MGGGGKEGPAADVSGLARTQAHGERAVVGCASRRQRCIQGTERQCKVMHASRSRGEGGWVRRMHPGDREAVQGHARIQEQGEGGVDYPPAYPNQTGGVLILQSSAPLTMP